METNRLTAQPSNPEPSSAAFVDAQALSGCRFTPVSRSDHRRALALLLTGHSDAHSPAVDQFLTYARQQNLTLQHLWWALRHDEPQLAALLMPCAGRTAMMFLSPAPAPGITSGIAPGIAARSGMLHHLQPMAVELIKRAVQSANPAQVQLIQALLEPRQTHVEHLYQQAGFTKLATLVYLENALPMNRTAPSPVPANWPDRFKLQLTTYSPAQHDLFARTILASYQDTRDCPGLRGLRDIADIIDGHQSIGRFDPLLWHELHQGDEPVGVMLLNPLPTQGTMELVYLGLTPAWRGKGLGKTLLQWGLELTRAAHLGTMICAVDASNTPAVNLYQSVGFVATGKKVALIRTH